MNLRKKITALLITASALWAQAAAAQNALINILTKDAGIIRSGGSSFIEVTVNNTDPAKHIGIYKLKVKITIPAGLISIDAGKHQLPTGWLVTGSDASGITLSNGKDMIAATDARTLLIAVKGSKPGGPSTITGQLSFSDGTAPGTAPGSLQGDLPGDNISTTTCTVIR